MNRQTKSQFFGDLNQFPERAFLFCSFITTEMHKNHFIEVLKFIKNKYKDSFIVVSSHLPLAPEICSLIDAFIFSKNNPIQNIDINTPNTVHRVLDNISFPENDINDLHVIRPRRAHGYTHHLNKYDGLQYLKSQRIEYAHVLTYDVRLDKLNELDEHYSLMKNDGYDLIYYEVSEMQGAMATEYFSIRVSSSEDTLLKILSFDEYDDITDICHEKSYFELFNKLKKFKFGETINFGDMGIVITHTYSTGNAINNIDVRPIPFHIAENVVLYMYTLSNSVLPKYEGIDEKYYESLNPIDTEILIPNESNVEKSFILEFYDMNFVLTETFTAKVPIGGFYSYNIPNNFKYLKIKYESIIKAFIDIRDIKNYVTVVRTKKLHAW